MKLVSLLRGINVGGHHMIAMRELREMYESMGFHQVKTVLQSGNVVFSTADVDVAGLGARIEDALESRFGFRPMVILRTFPQVQDALARIPFDARAIENESWLAVMFLGDAPAAVDVDALTAGHHGPELLGVAGRELHLYYAEGIGRSKLTNALLERALKTKGTVRNVRTLRAIVAVGPDTPGPARPFLAGSDQGKTQK